MPSPVCLALKRTYVSTTTGIFIGTISFGFTIFVFFVLIVTYSSATVASKSQSIFCSAALSEVGGGTAVAVALMKLLFLLLCVVKLPFTLDIDVVRLQFKYSILI